MKSTISAHSQHAKTSLIAIYKIQLTHPRIIAFGVISHVLIQVFAGKGKDINGGTWVIAGLFTVMFLVTH